MICLVELKRKSCLEICEKDLKKKVGLLKELAIESCKVVWFVFKEYSYFCYKRHSLLDKYCLLKIKKFMAQRELSFDRDKLCLQIFSFFKLSPTYIIFNFNWQTSPR